jgi:hypothetical protein
VDIDTKDAKFNETYSDYRERQGKITTAPFIDADLRVENDVNTKANSCKSDTDDTQRAMNEPQQRRHINPRQFLIPGTHQQENGA